MGPTDDNTGNDMGNDNMDNTTSAGGKVDTLQGLNTFAHSIVDAMNDHRVRSVTDMGAVMVIVANDEDEAPIGASLNFDKKTSQWVVIPQAVTSERLEDMDDEDFGDGFCIDNHH